VKLSLAFLCLCACTPSHGPKPTPGPFDGDPTGRIYGELVEAGCLAPDDASEGYAAIFEEHQSDMSPLWLDCLYASDKATLASCDVPCEVPKE
jgi:hypothetical protein